MEGSGGGLPPDARETVVSRLEEAPVRLAVLFGSRATGDATAASDIDVGVVYDQEADVADAHLSLVADLTRILGREDVDVVRLDAVEPRVAVEALDGDDLLVGSSDDLAGLRDRFERQRQEREDTVRDRISDAEQAIERRLREREHG